MEKKKQIAYSEAIKEVETILERFESEEFDLDSLASEVKRATELIALCKEKLRKAEDALSNIMNGDDA